MEYAKSGVLNEEVRRRSQGTSSQSDILFAEDHGRGKTRHSRSRDKSRNKSRSKYQNHMCYHCERKDILKGFAIS